MTVTIPHDEMGRPDLQELVRIRGGQPISAADWRAWDTAITKWRQDCRDRLCRELDVSKRHHHHQLRRYRGKERPAGATRRQ
jgi:hypothetical protein